MRVTDVFPTIPRVKRLVVSEPQPVQESIDFWIWLRALQGLANRAEPHLYLISGKDERRPGQPGKAGKPWPLYEDHWLDYYLERFGLPVERLEDVDALIDRYKDAVNGYVLYDTERVLPTQNLAITRAGLEAVLPVAPDQ